MKKKSEILSENFQILVVKFWIYLNRREFVMCGMCTVLFVVPLGVIGRLTVSIPGHLLNRWFSIPVCWNSHTYIYSLHIWKCFLLHTLVILKNISSQGRTRSCDLWTIIWNLSMLRVTLLMTDWCYFLFYFFFLNPFVPSVSKRELCTVKTKIICRRWLHCLHCINIILFLK